MATSIKHQNNQPEIKQAEEKIKDPNAVCNNEKIVNMGNENNKDEKITPLIRKRDTTNTHNHP